MDETLSLVLLVADLAVNAVTHAIDNPLGLVLLTACLVVLWKVAGVCASIDIRNFDGHPVIFCGMALYWALFGAGAVAVAFAQPIGGYLLLAGLAVFCLVDRRHYGHG